MLVVAVDALRGGDGARRPVATTTSGPSTEAAATLSALGARGTLVYTDRDCRLHALRLPTLSAVAPPRDTERIGCWFELSPGGTRIAPAGSAWTRGGVYARCNGSSVELWTRQVVTVTRGCAPAWRPVAGRTPILTLARSGEIVACERELSCETVITRAAIRAAARQHPSVSGRSGAPAEVTVLDLAWLSVDRAVLLLRIDVPRVGLQDLVAVFEGGRVRGSYYFLDTDRNQLEASAHGRYVAAGTGWAVRADGPRLEVPNAFGRVRELAWSPDERWLALAARDALALVRVGPSSSPRVVTLPIDASDVGWASG